MQSGALMGGHSGARSQKATSFCKKNECLFVTKTGAFFHQPGPQPVTKTHQFL
jgi:hypothetical protein